MYIYTLSTILSIFEILIGFDKLSTYKWNTHFRIFPYDIHRNFSSLSNSEITSNVASIKLVGILPTHRKYIAQPSKMHNALQGDFDKKMQKIYINILGTV